MDSISKGLIIISGIPASGKTFMSNQIKYKLQIKNILTKLLSTDNVQAFITSYPDTSLQDLKHIFSQSNWDDQIKHYHLNKKHFNEKVWNFSRKSVESFLILDQLFQTCQILIIQDQLPLKSQRKPFKKYCSQRKIKYLEIQIQITLEQALQNNNKRGHLNQQEKVQNQVIQKSFQKYQINKDSQILSKNDMKKYLNQQDILSQLKYVQIQDNYFEYLKNQNTVHELTQNQLDQNELRKLISKIIQNQNDAQQYFKIPLSSKEKAQILSECKKIYIHNKRKIPFKDIINQFMEKIFIK